MQSTQANPTADYKTGNYFVELVLEMKRYGLWHEQSTFSDIAEYSDKKTMEENTLIDVD